MLTERLNLYGNEIEDILETVVTSFPYSTYDYEFHLIHLINSRNDKVGHIRLPLSVSVLEDLSVDDEFTTVLYLSIEAGNASVCVQEGDDNIYHTTFSAYMTRKKQGYSQVKYLNKKGKSRAGSRVRLASTIEFFENINELLSELFEELEVDRIAISCTPTLTPYLYDSKAECPFTKQDERLYKIPLHIPQSNYTNLSGTIKKLKAPVLFFDENYETEIMSQLQDLRFSR